MFLGFGSLDGSDELSGLIFLLQDPKISTIENSTDNFFTVLILCMSFKAACRVYREMTELIL